MLRVTFLAGVLALAAGSAVADPGYYVVTPYDNAGIRMVDFRYWTVKPQGGTEVVWPEVGLAYGVTSRWTTELLLSYIGSSQMATRLSTLNWQNDVLLTQGELPFDLALHMLMTSNRMDPDYSAVEVGPVFQTDVDRTQLNANLFFEHNYGPQAPSQTFLKYQWQVRHRWMRQLHVGAQGFGEVGPWDDWLPRAKQSHRAGPALFTTVHLAEDQALKLQAAYLIGKTYGRNGHEFTMQAVYEF
ncbi:MAG: hypothetical protein OEU93_11690 [Rubrivivax sp.]|nr:hypothetical protein [Rubrivivax sp.]